LKTRLVLLALAVAACIVFNGMVDTLQPSLDAAIAVDQLQDSETAAITMRGVSRFENFVPLLSWSSVGLFGLLLFYKQVYSAIKGCRA